MKKLLLLLFSLMLSFNSYGEWTKTNEDDDGDAYYIDFQTVKKLDNGNVVFWVMLDSVKGVEGTLDNELYMSSKMFWQGDCDLFRFKVLSITQFEKPMGRGDNESWDGYLELMGMDAWNYLPPDSIGYMNLNEICSLAEHYSKNNYEEKVLETIAEFESYEWEDANLTSEVFPERTPSELSAQQQLLQSAWLSNIEARVKTFWRYQGAEDDWWCEVYVIQKRNGEVEAVDVQNCHNISKKYSESSFKNSIERAVYKSSPLPSAPDDSVFDKQIAFIFFGD